MKKHVSQMSRYEKDYLEQRFKSIPQSHWKFNHYSKRRAQSRGVDMAVFRSLWTDGFDLVEYHKHEEFHDSRILLRSITTDAYDRQLCAVFNLDTKEVSTVYLNWRKNKHRNLVWREYDSSLDVRRQMRIAQ